MSTRLLSVAVAASALAFVAAPYRHPSPEEADLRLMQGTWECAGGAWSPGGIEPKHVLVTGTALTAWQGGHKLGEWTLRLNAPRSPRAFAAIPISGGEPLAGTYEFVEGGLRLRWASRDGAGATPLVLNRSVPLSATPAVLPGPGEARAASVRTPPPPMLR